MAYTPEFQAIHDVSERLSDLLAAEGYAFVIAIEQPVAKTADNISPDRYVWYGECPSTKRVSGYMEYAVAECDADDEEWDDAP